MGVLSPFENKAAAREGGRTKNVEPPHAGADKFYGWPSMERGQVGSEPGLATTDSLTAIPEY